MTTSHSTPWMSIAATAKRMTVSESTVKRLILSGDLKCFRPTKGRVVIHKMHADAAIMGMPTKLSKRNKELIADINACCRD